MPIIKTIDNKIDCTSHSLLYLPFSSIISSNPKNYSPQIAYPMLIQCLVHYYSKNLYVATGQGINTLAYSSNGTQWTGLGSTIFTVSGNGVVGYNGFFVSVG